MEDLNKHQTVLLVLLISFVTSIATGIMTVSLLQQAPVEITRNINRVVERTIEKVSSTDILTPSTSNTNKNTEVTTIVVKEEDSVINAIAKNTQSIVRITEKDILTQTTNFFSIGLVLSKDGVILAVKKPTDANNTYIATLGNGTEIQVTPLATDKKTNFIIFRPQLEKDKNKGFTPVAFSLVDARLGQSVIGIGGEATNAIAVARVTLLNTKDTTVGTTTAKTIVSVDTDIVTKDLALGSPLLNLSGDIVGIRLIDGTQRSFVPSSSVRKDISLLLESVK